MATVLLLVEACKDDHAESSNANLPARWIRIQYCHALEKFSLCRLKGDTWERKSRTNSILSIDLNTNGTVLDCSNERRRLYKY